MGVVDNELLLTNKILFALDEMKPDEAVDFLERLEDGLDGIDAELCNSILMEVIWFFTDTDSKKMNDYAEKKISEHNKIPQRDAIWEQYGKVNELLGECFSRECGDQGVVFTPDASEPGRIRYTEFDASGFFGHSTFDTLKEAFDSAWDVGYHVSAPVLLNELAVTDKWKSGMEAVLFIQAENAKSSKVNEIAQEPPASTPMMSNRR